MLSLDQFPMKTNVNYDANNKVCLKQRTLATKITPKCWLFATFIFDLLRIDIKISYFICKVCKQEFLRMHMTFTQTETIELITVPIKCSTTQPGFVFATWCLRHHSAPV